MYSTIVTIHVLVCIVLILAVLLQSGKGGGLSSAFGAGGGASGGMAGLMFGGRGAATFLSKVTTILATLYMLIIIGLNLLPDEGQRPRSIIQEEALNNQQTSPAQGLPDVDAGSPVSPLGDPSQPGTTGEQE